MQKLTYDYRSTTDTNNLTTYAYRGPASAKARSESTTLLLAATWVRRLHKSTTLQVELENLNFTELAASYYNVMYYSQIHHTYVVFD